MSLNSKTGVLQKSVNAYELFIIKAEKENRVQL